MEPVSIKVITAKITGNIDSLRSPYPEPDDVYQLLSKYRYLLTEYESVLAYSLLGVIAGIVSGLVVLAFELALVQISAGFGVGNFGEDFESLPRALHFAMPAGAGLCLGIAFALLKPADRETGIVHVISCMHNHYSVLPLRNALVQFIGGAFALGTGLSGGREGPGVHLGGAANSLFGQWLGLPNNSLRVLIACGTAGGISAAFQTPLAGVIFAMEVIVAEYSVVGFIPVILAAVSASAISYFLSAGSILPDLPELGLNSLSELPLIILLGLVCGTVVTAFIRISALSARLSNWPVLLRFALAGCATGLLAYWTPAIMGMGYDTLELTLQGRLAISALLTIALAKLLATALCCGVGMPVGLIAPILVIGGCIGGVLGTLSDALFPDLGIDQTLYVVLGTGAAMGAALNAPLAAILAIMELTGTINIGMPAMLAIVTATLTNNGIFRQRSAHQTVLHQLRRAAPEDPLNQLLHSSSVKATMDSRVVRVPMLLDEEGLTTLLEFTPTWCVIQRDEDDLYLVSGEELLNWLRDTPITEGEVDLTEADIRRWTIAPVPMQASLRQAADAMREQTTEAVCVYERSERTGKQILQGVVTREGIEKFSLAGLR